MAVGFVMGHLIVSLLLFELLAGAVFFLGVVGTKTLPSVGSVLTVAIWTVGLGAFVLVALPFLLAILAFWFAIEACVTGQY